MSGSIRIVDMPDIGAFTSTSSVVGEHAGSGRFSANSLGLYLHDRINVVDHGAKLDGTTDDSAAFQAARAAIVGQAGSIVVPRGKLNVGTVPTAGTPLSIVWAMDGVTHPGSDTATVMGMGTDIVENTLYNDGKYFGRQNSYTGAGTILRVDNTLNHATGTPGNTEVSMAVNTNASGAFPEAVFGFNSTITTTKTAGGDHVSISGYTNRHPGAGVFGCWGANLYVYDSTGLKSSLTGACVGAEISVFANDIDDGAANGIRVILDAVGVKAQGSVDAIIGWGVRCGPAYGATNITFGRHFAAYGNFNAAAFSTEFATQLTGANAIWLGTGHRIALDTAGAGGAANMILSGNGSMATLAGGGLTINSQRGGWSTLNIGKQLLVTDVATTNHPSIAITDSNGTNTVGMYNYAGVLNIAAMPAYTDTSTAPNTLATVGPSGITLAKQVAISPLPPNAPDDVTAAAAGVPYGGLYRNGSVIQIRTV